MAAALPREARQALTRGLEHGGELLRVHGQFWSYPGAPRQVQSGGLPVWWTSGDIVRLLITVGFAEVIERMDEAPTRVRLLAD